VREAPDSRPGGAAYRAFKLDVVRVQSGLIAEITAFDAKLFPAFGLEPVLSAAPRAAAQETRERGRLARAPHKRLG
jgi:hypothetical protein